MEEQIVLWLFRIIGGIITGWCLFQVYKLYLKYKI